MKPLDLDTFLALGMSCNCEMDEAARVLDSPGRDKKALEFNKAPECSSV